MSHSVASKKIVLCLNSIIFKSALVTSKTSLSRTVGSFCKHRRSTEWKKRSKTEVSHLNWSSTSPTHWKTSTSYSQLTSRQSFSQSRIALTVNISGLETSFMMYNLQINPNHPLFSSFNDLFCILFKKNGFAQIVQQSFPAFERETNIWYKTY